MGTAARCLFATNGCVINVRWDAVQFDLQRFLADTRGCNVQNIELDVCDHEALASLLGALPSTVRSITGLYVNGETTRDDSNTTAAPLRHVCLQTCCETTQQGLASLLRPRGAHVVELHIAFETDSNEQNKNVWRGLLDWLKAPWTQGTLERLILHLGDHNDNETRRAGYFVELAWRLSSLPCLREFLLASEGLTMGWPTVYALVYCTRGRCDHRNDCKGRCFCAAALLEAKVTEEVNNKLMLLPVPSATRLKLKPVK